MAFNEKAPTIKEITTAVTTSGGAIQYLRVNGLLRRTCVCEKCGVAMGIMKTDWGDGEIFKCGNCYSKKSIRHGSFFEVSHVLVVLYVFFYLGHLQCIFLFGLFESVKSQT